MMEYGSSPRLSAPAEAPQFDDITILAITRMPERAA
jgi:hypothetical protein